MIGLAIGSGIFACLTLELGALTNRDTCRISEGCSAVATSPLVNSLGFRLSSVGLAVFLVAWSLYAFNFKKQLQALWTIGFLISTGLTLYAVFGIKAVCWLCLMVFGAFALGTYALFEQPANSRASVTSVPTPVAGIVFAIVFAFTSPPEGEPKRVAEDMSKVIRTFPLSGTDSNTRSAVLVDFSCRHCREKLRSRANNKESFYVVPTVNRQELTSNTLATMFVAAHRQKLTTRFCEIIPPDPLIKEWMAKLSKELSPTKADEQGAQKLGTRAKEVAEALSVRTIPRDLILAP